MFGKLLTMEIPVVLEPNMALVPPTCVSTVKPAFVGVLFPIPTKPAELIKTRVWLLVVKFRGTALVVPNLEVAVALALPISFQAAVCAVAFCKPDNEATAIAHGDKCLFCLHF